MSADAKRRRGCGVWRSAAMRSADAGTRSGNSATVASGAAPRRAPISMVMAARGTVVVGSPSAASFRDSKATMSCARSPGWRGAALWWPAIPPGFVSGSSLPCHRHRCFQRRRSCATRSARLRSGVTSAAGLSGVSSARRRTAAMASASSRSSGALQNIDIGQEHPCGPDPTSAR